MFVVCYILDPGGEGVTDSDPNTQREASSKMGTNSRMKLMSYSESGDGSDGDAGFMGQVMPRLPGSVSFPVGTMPMSNMGDPALFSGQVISPTQPQGPLQYMQHQVRKESKAIMWPRPCHTFFAMLGSRTSVSY